MNSYPLDFSMALRQDRFSILQSQGIRETVIKLGYILQQIKETLSFVELEQTVVHCSCVTNSTRGDRRMTNQRKDGIYNQLEMKQLIKNKYYCLKTKLSLDRQYAQV
jgi:hypothetical protein